MISERVDAARPVTPHAALERLDFVAGEQFEMAELPGGLTNRDYKVTTQSGRRFVARFSAARSALLAIDRDVEWRNTAAAASVGIGPDVVEFRHDELVLVVSWIDGRTLADADLADEHMLSRVAQACRILHAGPRFAGNFDIFAVQRKYLDIVREFGFKLPEDYLSFEPQVRRLQQVLHASAGPTVPCHNDLLAANIMDAHSQIRFVDFEYSGNNDPCFELGNIWSEAVLSTDHLAHLVAAYHGSESPQLVARARLFGLIAKYAWTLWASIQHAVSDVDFDFWSWGMEKYARAVAEFRGTEFERLVTAAELPHTSNRPHAATDDRHTQ